MQAHTVWVLTDQPLRTILHRLETSGRLVKWSVKLSKFDIQYHPHGAIKGQAIVDLIVEYTYASSVKAEMHEKQQEEEEVDQVGWIVHMDGSSTNSAAKGGVVLITLEKSKLEYTIRFRLKATNNEAKYELMITGLCLTYTLWARNVKVNSGS